jgi:hypothetical protein
MNPIIGAIAIATATFIPSIFSMLQFKSASMEQYSEIPRAALADIREMKDEASVVETHLGAFELLVAYQLEDARQVPRPTNAPKQSGGEPKKQAEEMSGVTRLEAWAVWFVIILFIGIPMALSYNYEARRGLTFFNISRRDPILKQFLAYLVVISYVTILFLTLLLTHKLFDFFGY